MSWFTFPSFHLTVKAADRGEIVQQKANAKAEMKTYLES